MTAALSVVGYSNSGKTTLITDLIKEFNQRGYRIGVIKHSPHEHTFQEKSEKDSYQLWEAGADAVCFSSPSMFTLTVRPRQEIAPEEIALLMRGVDLIISEGYKKGSWPKIAVSKLIDGVPAVPPGEYLDIVEGYSVNNCASSYKEKVFSLADLIENNFLLNET